MKKNTNTPNKPTYPTCNEFKNRRFLNLATAFGIGVSALAISLDIDADEKKPASESKKAENSEKKVKDTIILLVADLGNKDFSKRDKATLSLIDLGGGFKKKKNSEMSKFLKAELEKCEKSKDPEVKARAKAILLAIVPPPPRPPNRQIKGKIAPAGW